METTGRRLTLVRCPNITPNGERRDSCQSNRARSAEGLASAWKRRRRRNAGLSDPLDLTDPPERCRCGAVATLRIVGECPVTDGPVWSYVCQRCGLYSVPNKHPDGCANAWHRGELVTPAECRLAHQS